MAKGEANPNTVDFETGEGRTAILEGVSAEQRALLRERWQREHTPADEWSPDFPLAGLARYAELALQIGRELGRNAPAQAGAIGRIR